MTDRGRTPSPEFWNGQRVFVTGSTGFNGSWLVVWLKMLGAEVHGYALAPETTPNMFGCLGLDRLCTTSTADIRDRAALARALDACRPSIVFHLAAQSLVLPSYEDPLATLETNVIGTANVLDACRRTEGIAAVINVTTDKVYANMTPSATGFHEDDALGAGDPYSSSKACADLVGETFGRAFAHDTADGKPAAVIASARSGNTIGGGDWNRHRIIPDAVRAFSKNAPIALRHPGHVRPWQHVLETLNGYIALAEAAAGGGVESGSGWNFGPDESQVVSVREIIEMFCAAWGEGAAWTSGAEANAPHEAQHLLLNSDKAKRQLGWYPGFDLATTVDMTAKWYRAFADDPSADSLLALTRAQIETFVAAIEARTAQ